MRRGWVWPVAIWLFVPVQVQAQRLLFYAATDGSVQSVDIDAQAAGPTLTADRFLGANPGAGRNISVASSSDLLFYAVTDGSIASVDIQSSAAGPSFSAALFQGANPGADRHFIIDPLFEDLYYAVTNGDVGVIDLTTGTHEATLPASLFQGANPGGLRHLAIDPFARVLYYAVTDGSIASLNLGDLTPGPGVSAANLLGANPGAFRHIVFDPSTALLWYAVSDGSVASINPVTEIPGPTLSGGLFAGANPGAGRIITLRHPVVSALLVSGSANQTSFAPGETLVVSALVDNPGIPATVDFYFGAVLPDGDTIVFFTDLLFNTDTGSLSDLSTLRPIVAGVALSSPFEVDEPNFFSFTRSSAEPSGAYVLFLAAVVAGGLDDGQLGTADLIGLSLANITFP